MPGPTRRNVIFDGVVKQCGGYYYRSASGTEMAVAARCATSIRWLMKDSPLCACGLRVSQRRNGRLKGSHVFRGSLFEATIHKKLILVDQRRTHATLERMDTTQIVALLIAERDRLNTAIQALQGPTKRRGRPPKNAVAAVAPAAAPEPPKRKRRKFTAAQRKAASGRMRQRWAARKKAATASAAKKKARAA